MTKLEDNLGFLVARTHRAMRRWIMARLDPLNLTYEQYKVLIALSEQDNVSQTELADRVNMDKTSLARMLDRRHPILCPGHHASSMNAWHILTPS